jgi:hypothetical protein
MSFNRLPARDPRTVARDIPGVLDILFPRLNSGLVTTLNKELLSFSQLSPIPKELIERSKVQKSMLFELSMVRVESLLKDSSPMSWDDCLAVATTRQRRHFDARIPEELDEPDIEIANRAAENLFACLKFFRTLRPKLRVVPAPFIPGLGWISSGNGDFALGQTLIEVKHIERNFGANDFRQVLMYWLLKYAKSLEDNSSVWDEVILLNPRRNVALRYRFDHLLKTASADSNHVELVELLRSAVSQEFDRR